MESVKIQKLKLSYKGKLRDKLNELNQLYNNLNDDQGNSNEPLFSLQDFLHKLAGSSGMYGYDDISIAAQEAMDVCSNVCLSNDFPALRKLQDLLEQHARG